MKLLIKDAFTEFVGEFMKLPWEVRKDILSEYPEEAVSDKLRSLYKDLLDEIVDPDEWKNIFRDLSSQD